MTATASRGPRGLRFALLAHPSVQAVRFATKLALPWFFTTEEFGEAVLPSLVVFGLQHVAVFGLDEALVSARALDAPLWRAMRRFQDRLAIVLVLALVATGLGLYVADVAGRFGVMLAALAPMLFVANRATLPTWLLVRERHFFDLFVVDLASVVAFGAATITGAAFGFGPWSLLLGWWANAICAHGVAAARARALVPTAPQGGPPWAEVRRNGGHLTTAAVLAYAGDRADGIGTGFVLGRAALGLLENAQNLAGVLLGWGQSVADRYLFPTLAADGRAAGSGAGYLRALRTTILYVVPPHVVLALGADPLVRTFFPASWHGTEPLLVWLALAAAARCVDLLAVTALKAAGRADDVARLGAARLAVLLLALAASLPHGIESVAAAVCAARAISAALALWTASGRLDLRAQRRGGSLWRAVACFVAWAVGTSACAHWLAGARPDWPPIAGLAALAAVAMGAWIASRLLLDGRALRAEVIVFRARFERGPA